MEKLDIESPEQPEMVTINNLAEKLSEARFKFALKCLQTVVQKKPSENVLFCPYSIYEGLLMVYFASGSHTERHLKRILLLPNIPREYLAMYHQKERIEENREDSEGNYDGNQCWIKNSKRLFTTEACFFNTHKCNVFDRSEIHYLTNDINELLKIKMRGSLFQPVELSELRKNMEFILLSEFHFRGGILQRKLLRFQDLVREPTHALSSTLGMFVNETKYQNRNQSMYLLFPAVQSIVTKTWEIDDNISGLVERLTTEEGADELRKVLEGQVSSTENVVNPVFIELEHELPIDVLLEELGIRELLEPDNAILSNFTHENLHLGGAMHRAYVMVTPKNLICDAVNMFFTKNEVTFKSIEGTNYQQYKNAFVLLIYDKYRHDILFIGVIDKNYQLPEVSSAAHTASSSNVVEIK